VIAVPQQTVRHVLEEKSCTVPASCNLVTYAGKARYGGQPVAYLGQLSMCEIDHQVYPLLVHFPGEIFAS
jgi:hypothetical protein